jgi:hypothetical protein
MYIYIWYASHALWCLRDRVPGLQVDLPDPLSACSFDRSWRELDGQSLAVKPTPARQQRKATAEISSVGLAAFNDVRRVRGADNIH